MNEQQGTVRREIDLVKSVCGGGKSYAMLQHMRENNDNNFLYVVPTIVLADDIAKRWREDGHPETDIKLIHSKAELIDSQGTLLAELNMALSNAFVRQVVVITHELLFSEGLLDPNLWIEERLGDWKVIIDENPELIREYQIADSKNLYKELGEIAKPQCIPGEFTLIELTEGQRGKLKGLVSGPRHETTIDDGVHDLIEAVANRKRVHLFATPSDKGHLYYAVVLTQFSEIIDAARSVTILSSRLAGLTPIYLQKMQIGIVKSDVDSRAVSYPESVQQQVSVWRAFSHGNMSISRLDEYGAIKLFKEITRKTGVISQVLLRSNEKYAGELKRLPLVEDVVSKVTNGLNSFDHLLVFVDIAAYNRNMLLNNAYTLMDELWGLESGEWKRGVVEANTELSTQAAFRIGIRRFGGEEFDTADRYTIVVPDERTERYLRKAYLPNANYLGGVVDDGKSGKSKGRPSGKTASTTKTKVAEVTRLKALGLSQNKACQQVGIAPDTYRRNKA